MKKLILITAEEFVCNEGQLIMEAIDCGVDYVHIRKPHATIDRVAHLVESISSAYHSQLVLHDFHSLAMQYNVAAIHLNARQSTIPSWWDGYTSRSCHTLEEIIRHKNKHKYLFLSPIYDSISKTGYTSTFSLQLLHEVGRQGIIDDNVIAMGGICTDNVKATIDCGFGGVAVLGSIWKEPTIEHIHKDVKQLKQILSCYNS